MGRWRTKVLCCLVVYGAGFATAIYTLAPSPTRSDDDETHERILEARVDGSQEWAVSMRTGLDKIVSFAEENAVRGLRAIQTQMDQQRQNSER